MTQTLEKAWNTLINLPEEKQESIAYMILDEINDEQQWENQFSNSEQELIKISNKVRIDIKVGSFKEKGFGEL
ncbi:MAG: hypothetical protein A2X61_10660 [Ignavibacteria bacterium GWB2_35_12]|nr:MAG: hypothetical protein A2X63_12745 [Ignavibacteria bacterium GWA2_35_8]OGU42694.1 MAG: hypothetical protein A2X61_10660 [Ignavibacteria bacterium GWB2_35_12]OGU89369.1 MAG: hypothetical protein A2220_01105 [Ignavibacteria bacterium RIFOXYA2_FULL_35_10]OGV19290.1 MAG: hypothetical protein A2475_03840 [Ignavibacteria bacterium RIFOXYC2_FULL_35_21]